MSAGTTRVRSVSSLAVHNREKASRGTLTVTTAVVEKVAAHVAAQSEGFGAPTSSFFGSGSRADFDRGPKVRAVLVGSTADLEVEVAIGYPAPVQAQCDDLRARLTEQVPKLSGVQIGTIDILVSRVVNQTSTTKELN
ncbi:Asp23/Gls24 family envelope stress response protein [Cutibacterium equinum]|uniref:Asp23/Gls24 family envelope stress response protein n=1 Tax=Cutibacterium equinum TaxID=3016342 RepID=A0ABY7R035_9ACTN|nr:Asp23/Gls24 family envelope stress response protein [Cutibacterium equinum]WCC80285.1 Asp23/Gls24 family envelope stress response protein [Cutibacterium equinum]